MHIIICVWFQPCCMPWLKGERGLVDYHELCIGGIPFVYVILALFGEGVLFWFCLGKQILPAPSKCHLQNVNLQSPQNISNSSGICKYINLLFSRGNMVCFRWILDVNSKQVDRAAGGKYQASHRGPTSYSCRKWITEIGDKGNQICQA